jgi:ribosomal protein L29
VLHRHQEILADREACALVGLHEAEAKYNRALQLKETYLEERRVKAQSSTEDLVEATERRKHLDEDKVAELEAELAALERKLDNARYQKNSHVEDVRNKARVSLSHATGMFQDYLI